MARSTAVVVDRVAGSSSSSQSFTCTVTCLFRISPAGAANICPRYRSRAHSSWRLTGSAKSSSPSTASIDQTEISQSIRERVGHVWLVDPLLQTLEVLRLDGAGSRLVGAWRAEAVVQCELSKRCRFGLPIVVGIGATRAVYLCWLARDLAGSGSRAVVMVKGLQAVVRRLRARDRPTP